MSTYNPNIELQLTNKQGFVSANVNDMNVAELLKEVIIQLRLVSAKLDCLQPNEDTIDATDLEIDAEDL